ncbi:TPA: polysaccharide lyase 8 family protein [Streptococcus pyogenes]
MNTYFCTHHKQLLLYSNLFLSFAMMGQGTAIYADTLTSNSEPNNTYFQTQTPTTTDSEKKVVQSQQKDYYTELLDQWNSIIAGNDAYDKTNPDMVTFHNKAEKDAQNIIKSYQGPDHENRTYLWEHAKDYSASANITKTYRNIEKIAKQITNPESCYYQDSKAIAIVKDGMAFMYEHAYNLDRENHQTTGKENKENWWVYEIGTPRAINNTLSLMYPYFTQEEILKYTTPIEKFVPDPTRFRVRAANFSPFEANSGNLIDMGRVKLISGILRKDDLEISDTIKAIEKVFTLVDEGNGFYQDGSLIDHVVTNAQSPLYKKGIAYTGAYGNVLIDGLSQLIPIIQKTKSPIEADKMATIYHWINHSFFPIIVRGEMMDMTRGRSISRFNAQSHVAGIEALRAILRIADMSEEPHRLALKTRIKTLVTQGNAFYNVYDNLKTYHDIKLMKELLSDTFVASKKLNNTSALAAMTFTNWNKSLTLNKGWFILGNKIIFVGSNIKNQSSHKAYTTIEQRKENQKHPYCSYVNNQPVDLNNQLVDFTNTKSIFLESDDPAQNIGYYFFKPTTLSISKALQTGKWQNIKADDKSPEAIKEVSNTFITIMQNHTQDGDRYAYMMLPNMTRQEFETYISKLDIDLLENNDKLAAVYDHDSQQMHVIHYEKKATTFSNHSLSHQGFYSFPHPVKQNQQ